MNQWRWLAVVVAVSGCGSPAVQVDPLPTPPVPISSIPTELSCTPLALRPEGGSVPPLGLVQLVPSGGSGAYVFSVEPEASGTIEASTWGFLAGASPGEVVVTVSDVECPGEASVRVEILAPFGVSPEAVLLSPGQGFSPVVSGGSGAVSCTLAQNQSGASLVGCAYVAGDAEGHDRIRLEDPGMGTFQEVGVDVRTQATFRISGGEGVVIPVGTSVSGRWLPQASSGSGLLDLAVLSGPFTILSGAVEATGTGEGEIEVVDRFTGDRVVVPVLAIQGQAPVLPRDGERSGQGVVLPLGDVDGDGFEDVAVGFIEPSIDFHYGGMVAIYRGGVGGFSGSADQVFAGGGVNWTLGRSMAVGDVDNDGELDLILGADRADVGEQNNGIVRIHRGLVGGLFETEPHVLIGELPFGRLGSALAVCDLNGDDWLDLIVGAREAADLATAVPAEDQGSIQIFVGGPAGFSDGPEFDVFGALPVNGAWTPAADLGLGASLAAGDFDGDGLCDVAAGAPDAVADDGRVFVYAGRDDGSVLSREPVRWLRGPNGVGAEFGRRLAAGDVDGDGRAELLVSAWKDGASREGAVYLYSGDANLSSVDPIDVALADWSAQGGRSFDFFGADVRLDDMNGDLRKDVVVGAYRAQDEQIDQGMVYAYIDPALSGGVFPAASASVVVEGAAVRDRFGQAVAGLGDVNADGVGDFIGLAGFSSTFGVEVGEVFFGSGYDGTLTSLGMPGVAAGHGIGASFARIDVDGDGERDVVFGAPNAGVQGVGGNAGEVFFSPSVGGVFGPAVPFSESHATHSGGDRFGTALAVTDFDGDGLDDLAIVARKDSRPAICGDAGSLTGSVHIYRGTLAGLEMEPSFVWFGSVERGGIERIIGGLDHDGDGLEDLIVASSTWEDTGGFVVLHGRGYSGVGLDAVCDAQPVFGIDRFDRLGRSLTSLGDLDLDGCDEFAVGATGEEFHSDWRNQGSVRVFWGTGSGGCPAEPQVSTLQLEVIGTGLGSALSGGLDVDGDGTPDLLVGGAEYRVAFAEHGAVWMVPGSWLLAAPRSTVEDGRLLGDAQTLRTELLPNQGLSSTYGLIGREAGSRYGGSVELVSVNGEVLLAVGSPAGGPGGIGRTGGIEIHRWEDGWVVPPVRLVVGEGRLDGHLGENLSRSDNLLLFGAPSSSVEGVSSGMVYILGF